MGCGSQQINDQNQHFHSIKRIIKMEIKLHEIIILLRKPFTRQMLQNQRQHQSNSFQSSKRQFHSLKYKEIPCNTPHLYSIPSLASSMHREKYREKEDKQSDSFETCQSQSTRYPQKNAPYNTRMNKIKVELCKNFVEKGYCPYENRCKFAHGIEQLRAKDTWGNSQLYRTRKCKIFYEKHQCKFGQRCNFMHQNRKIQQIVCNNSKAVRQAIRINFQEISLQSYTTRVQSSKLLGLLHQTPEEVSN